MDAVVIWSHSTRVRGLKFLITFKDIPNLSVALYTSAWIEIIDCTTLPSGGDVALYTSAWIEITCHPNGSRI